MNNKARLGYCCINLSLTDKKISANRGMIKKTFETKGKDLAVLQYLKNCETLRTSYLQFTDNSQLIKS